MAGGFIKMRALFQKRDGVFNSYDLLKALALLLMFVDHAGHFFYPDEMWFRVIGRLSVPIWFFLIGYANTRQVQSVIWIGAFVVLVSALVSGYYILPLNILFTLAIARLWIDRLMAGALRNYETFAGMFFILFFLSFPSSILFEYGTLGMMFSVYGFMRRNKEGLVINPLAYFGFLAAIMVCYVFFSGVSIAQLSMAQFGVLAAGVLALMVVFYYFEGREFSKVSKKLGVVLWPIKVMGRHTLVIYVGHLVVLNLVMLGVGDDRYGFGQVQILAPVMRQIINAVIG